ncbi:MAG: penicillin-binding protein activator [Gemmatimonadota bacterium]|nr:penicillin-binding protein activator [Gemmatimonadota bacterium]
MTLLGVAGCLPVQQGGAVDPGPAVPTDPAIERGAAPSAGAEATAARLLGEARAALERGDDAQARALATRIVDEFASVPGTAQALWIRAQAERRAGAPADAAADARRFVAVLPEGDERRLTAARFAAEAFLDASEPTAAVRALLDLAAAEAQASGRTGVDLARTAVRRIPTDTLLVLAEQVGPGPMGDLVELEAAVGLYFRDEVARAAQIARALLQESLTAEDRRIAESIVSGNAEAVLGDGVAVGALLPSTGSPVMREYASAIEEGVRVAFETRARDTRRPVRLEIRDDGGDPARTERSLRELEAAGAVGVIGPLLDDQLVAAARTRASELALISPTAERVPGDQGVYSLGATEPGAARALADYAVEQGFRRVAVVYPRTPAATADAQSFAQAYREGSAAPGREVREFTYEPGTTFFREQLMGVADFGAEAVVLPVPESDVELIAPQVSFFSLDSLGVRVLGTGSWASPDVLDRVDVRHLDGVVVASPRDPDGESAEHRRFVERYESVVRKTLRSPIPAYGYDAASLILEAIDRGARTPADLEAQLEGIRDFPGATGVISIEGGQIVRRHQLYLLEDGRPRLLDRPNN